MIHPFDMDVFLLLLSKKWAIQVLVGMRSSNPRDHGTISMNVT